MTNYIFQFIQMKFGKGKNLFFRCRYLKTLDGSFHRRFTQFSLRFTTTFCLVALNQPKTYPGSQRLFIRGFWFRVSLVAWVFGRRSIGLRREKKTPFILRVPEEN